MESRDEMFRSQNDCFCLKELKKIELPQYYNYNQGQETV